MQARGTSDSADFNNTISHAGLQGKKEFLPLPSLDAAQHKLPWRLNLSQKLGRHAIAGQNIQAGQCILAENAVHALPAQGQEGSSCHSCLRDLPGDSHLSQGMLSDRASKQYKQYCSPACSHADHTASITAAVHARIPQIAAETKCDPTLMHFILGLDAQRQHPPSNSASSSDSKQQTRTTASESTHATRRDPIDVITCTLADVEALLSPFGQNQKDWRDAITAGELHGPVIANELLQYPQHALSTLNTSEAIPKLGGVACQSALRPALL